MRYDFSNTLSISLKQWLHKGIKTVQKNLGYISLNILQIRFIPGIRPITALEILQDTWTILCLVCKEGHNIELLCLLEIVKGFGHVSAPPHLDPTSSPSLVIACALLWGSFPPLSVVMPLLSDEFHIYMAYFVFVSVESKSLISSVFSDFSF